MIHLILDNFRSFGHKEIFFEEGRSTLIAGKSGSGKTTVFMAINFALNGSGRDLIRHGQKKCRVVMSMGPLVITRQKGPDRLIVEKEGTVYEKHAAQAVIESLFENQNLGYVSQSTHRSFLMMTPAEKLKFIENMTFDRSFVEQINRNVKALVSERKLELEKTRKERTTMETTLLALKIECETEQPEGSFSLELEEELKVKREQLFAKVNDAVHVLEVKNKLQKDLQRLVGINSSIEELERKITRLTQQEFAWNQYSSCLSQLNNLIKPELSLEEIDEMMFKWTRMTQLDKELSKAKVLREKLNSIDCTKPLKVVQLDDDEIEGYLLNAKKYDDLYQIDRLLDSLPKSNFSRSLLTEIADLREKEDLYCSSKRRLEVLKVKKLESTVLTECPKCLSTLGFWNGKLIEMDCRDSKVNSKQMSAVEVKRIDEEILNLSIVCRNLESLSTKFQAYGNIDISSEMQRLKQIEDQRDALLKRKAAIGELEDFEYDSQKVAEVKTYVVSMKLYRNNLKEFERLSSKLDEYEDLQKERDQLQIPPVSYLELQSLKKKAQEYDYLVKKCSDLICDPLSETTDSYRKQLLMATEKRDKMSQLARIDLTEDDCVCLRRQLDDVERQLREVRQHFKQREAFEQWEKVRHVIKKENELELSYPRAVRLQSIVRETEKEALEEMLNQLNFHSQMYLEKFVDNLSIEFVFDSKIYANLTHRGHKTDVNSLSGGEFSRVMLAVTLALAEMHGVELLMLDESVSSLDQETTTDVLEVISENFKGTVLCIAHQTVRGSFDKVIELID